MKEVFIDEDLIAEHLFTELVKSGYAPTEEECEVIACIMFDYLVDLSIMDEIPREEE